MGSGRMMGRPEVRSASSARSAQVTTRGRFGQGRLQSDLRGLVACKGALPTHPLQTLLFVPNRLSNAFQY